MNFAVWGGVQADPPPFLNPRMSERQIEWTHVCFIICPTCRSYMTSSTTWQSVELLILFDTAEVYITRGLPTIYLTSVLLEIKSWIRCGENDGEHWTFKIWTHCAHPLLEIRTASSKGNIYILSNLNKIAPIDRVG